MKKNLLIIAAIAASMTASAQTSWLTGATGSNAEAALGVFNSDAGKAATVESADYVANAVEVGAGLTIANANNNAAFGLSDNKYVPYFQPTIAEGEGKTFDAADKTAYVAFYEETNETGTLENLPLSSIEFKASRVGTDAVRMKAFLQVVDAGGDVTYTKDLITADNASTVLTNGVYTVLYDVTNAETGEVSKGGFDGFQPARNKDGVYFKDGAEGADGTEQTAGKWYTQVNVPVPADFPADAWNAQLKVYIYGIHNNKQGVVYDVKFNHGGSSAVAGVAEAKSEAKKAVKVITANGIQIGNYNIAGQQVK